jgi:NADH dehydrogenase
MRVFLTGASGFVGSYLRRALTARGDVVVGLARRPQPGEAGMQWVVGDLHDVDALREAMDGCQAVVHLAAIIREHGADTFEEAHVRGTERVVAAARALAMPRVIFMSALGTTPRATTPYYRTKWQAEELVRASGLDYTIFRPSLIFGPGDGFISLLLDQVRRMPVIPVVGDGLYRFSPVSVHAVTAACLQAIDRTGADLPRAIDLCGPDTLTYVQIIGILCAHLRVHRPHIHLPVGLVTWGVRLLTALRLPTPATPDQIVMLLEGNACDGDEARHAFALPRITLEEGLAEYTA